MPIDWDATRDDERPKPDPAWHNRPVGMVWLLCLVLVIFAVGPLLGWIPFIIGLALVGWWISKLEKGDTQRYQEKLREWRSVHVFNSDTSKSFYADREWLWRQGVERNQIAKGVLKCGHTEWNRLSKKWNEEEKRVAQI